MNLHGLVSSFVGIVNPFVEAKIYRSKGYFQDESLDRQPIYHDPITMMVQKQAISQKDLEHIDNMNQQGHYVSIYTDGNWCGMSRNRGQGGDIFEISETGERWLVVSVPEIWADWTRVIVCLQSH